MREDLYEPHPAANPHKPYRFHAAKPNGGCMPHWHENIELLWFHSDSRVFCDRREYDFRAGDIAIFSSNSLHSVPTLESTEYDCIIVDNSFCAFNSIDIAKLAFDCQVRDEEASRLYGEVVRAVESSEDDRFGDAEVKCAILTLMLCLCRGWSHPSSVGSSPEHRAGGVIRSAIGYINSHLSKPMTVDEIADSAKVSKYYFCREFRRETGTTVVKYINNLRCRDAERILLTGDHTVGEVARMCGFDNMSYFTRTFKALTGRTPSEYLRKNNDDAIY